MDETGQSPSQVELSSETRSQAGLDVAVVRVRGEVDLATAGDLATSIAAASADGPLVIDLSGVSFMDSSGLRELLMVADERGERLAVVVEADSAVGRLFAIAEVADRLHTHPVEEDALAAVASGGEASP